MSAAPGWSVVLGDSLTDLEAKIHAAEHLLLPAVIARLSQAESAAG